MLCDRILAFSLARYISGSTSNVLMTPGAMGEEIRVDCCLMTRDGHSVVTGSSLGPPQVWNMSVSICCLL